MTILFSIRFLISWIWRSKNRNDSSTITYQFADIQEIPWDLPIWAVLYWVVLVDQRDPQESTWHIDEDGLLETFSEIDASRTIPFVRIDLVL